MERVRLSLPTVHNRDLILARDSIAQDKTPLPPPAATEEEDEALLQDEPYVEGPIKMDYGYNVMSVSISPSTYQLPASKLTGHPHRLGKGVYINSDCTFIDTCPITFGARTLVGPNCSFYSGTHPLDPFLRNGTKGPESGAPITIGEDCWLGGNAIVCPGVTIGRGVTVGAGSVVTRDVEDFCVVVGSPARVIKRIEPKAPDPRLAKDGNETAGSS
jgi:acetyltransferase-like isoleucine patch superfamily enzyme